eukprot:m.29898 g.29898  ORF g.29898 m.29898 type:complete len:774 (+) comp31251_c0_seq2:75-2396(+)
MLTLIFVSVVAYFTLSLGFETQIHSALRHFESLHKDNVSIKAHVSSHRKLEVFTLGRQFTLHLTHDTNLLTADFKAVVSDESGKSQIYDNIDRTQFLKGNSHGDDGSTVAAHIDSDGIVTATIFTQNEVFYIEPSHRHISEPHNFHMIAYRKSDVIRNYGERNESGSYSGEFCGITSEDHMLHLHAESGQDFVSQFNRVRRAIPVKHTCPIVLVADHKFFQSLGANSYSGTINFLISLIGDINNGIYRRTDFNGISGVGLQVALVLINTTSNSQKSHYNTNADLGVSALLSAFSQTTDWQQYCLAHLFTHRDFDKGVLGLAYVASPSRSSPGGICSPLYRGSRSLRTGLTSTVNYGRRLVKEEITVVTSHELGHNWGSPHDSSSGDCAGNSDGKFIMYPSATDGDDPNNRRFSDCSKRSIGAVLASKAPACFSEESNSFCGNFRIDEGEECDEGVPSIEMNRNAIRCCDDTCHILSNASCSDVNHVCCDQCRISNSTKRCRDSDSVHCIKEAFCKGALADCPAIEYEADGTPCINGGQCFGGKCIHLCEVQNHAVCECDFNSPFSCHLCCNISSQCQPFNASGISNISLGVEPNGYIILPNGSICGGQTGQCTNGTCVITVQDTQDRFWDIFGDFSFDAIARWFRDNIVADVLIFTSLVWIPSCLIVNHFDNERLRMVEEQEEQWLDVKDPKRRAAEKKKAATSEWAIKGTSRSLHLNDEESVRFLSPSKSRSQVSPSQYSNSPSLREERKEPGLQLRRLHDMKSISFHSTTV